jgi:hypothetical protein
MKRVSITEARALAGKQEPFRTHNGHIEGDWATPWLYVVYSYADRWPLYIYEKVGGTWLENDDKNNWATDKHARQVRPIVLASKPTGGVVWQYTDTSKHSCAFLKELIYDHVRAADTARHPDGDWA